MRRVSWWLFLAAIVVSTFAPLGAQAESNYAAEVAALGSPIYLRLNETGTSAELSDTVVNDGTVGTAGLGMTWGIHQSNGTSWYAGSQPGSGIAGVGPSVLINGNPCVGLESDNTCASFKNFKDSNPDVANSTALNVYDTSTTSTPVTSVNTSDITYSLFFKTTQTATDLDGTAYVTSGSTANYPHRLITSHPDNNTAGNRFDVILKSGMVVLVTGTTGNNVAENMVGTTPVTYNDGNWHHLVAIRQGSDASNAQLYIDGVLQSLAVSSQTGAGTYGDLPGYGLRIGSRGNKYYAFTGNMDEIALWGRALSASEAQGLYQAAVSVPEPSTIVLLGTLLLGGALFARRK